MSLRERDKESLFVNYNNQKSYYNLIQPQATRVGKRRSKPVILNATDNEAQY